LTTLDARCVYCRDKPVDPAWRPFCSERCKMADLGRWLTGSYNVPGEPAADEDAPDVTTDARNTDDHG
jgi:uncharacterized protein